MDRRSRGQIQGNVGRVAAESLPQAAGRMPARPTPQRETGTAPGRAMLGVKGARTARWRRPLAPMAPRHRRTRKARAAQAAPLMGGTAGRALAPPWGAGSAD